VVRHLRFDIQNSSLPDNYKEKILALSDNRISKDGIIVIKAQKFRSQIKNREDALNRLKSLILKSMVKQKKRKSQWLNKKKENQPNLPETLKKSVLIIKQNIAGLNN